MLAKKKEPLILEIFETDFGNLDEQQFRRLFVVFSVDLNKTL